MGIFSQETYVPRHEYSFRLSVGTLKPGFYKIQESKTLANFMKTSVRIEDEEECHYAKVVPGNDLPVRYVFIPKEGEYFYACEITSREAFIKANPSRPNINDYSLYGKELPESDLDNYPDCPLVNRISKSGPTEFMVGVELLYGV